jgi:hypothetical protein
MLKMNSNIKVKICCSNNNIIITKSTSELNFSDIMCSLKARWGINRMSFKVNPGLFFSNAFWDNVFIELIIHRKL